VARRPTGTIDRLRSLGFGSVGNARRGLPTVEPEAVMSLDENKALAKRLYIEVFGAGNMGAADEILAPDCVSHAADAPPMIGPDQIKRQAFVLRGAIPDLVSTLEDQVAEGDRVASRWIGSGTNTGALMLPTGAIPATGKTIRFGELRIDRFANGRIVESWFIPDRLALWQQLGVLPAPAPTPKA
jgi:predicted ester cyclase